MDKCKKCNVAIKLQKDGIKCNDCGSVFHLTCVAAGKVATRNNFKCDSCVTESSSTSSRNTASDRDSLNSGVLDAIAAFRKEFNERTDETVGKINKVQEDVNNVRIEVASLKTQYEDIKKQCDSMQESVETLEQANARMSRELACLSRDVNEMQQHSRKCNLLISGVPRTPGEDVFVVLESIANILNVVFHRSNISAAHRLPSGNINDQRPPLIVVNFISRIYKQQWLAARRSRGSLTARELQPSFPDQFIFINEHLTKETRDVFNGARRLVKEKKLASVWTSDCKVMAKRDVTAPPFRVRDLRQLRDLGLEQEVE